MGVANNCAFGITSVIPIIPRKFVRKSIWIKFLRDMSVWKVHTWRKTKYTIKGTQIKLIKLPIKIKENVALSTSRAPSDLNMKCAEEFKCEVLTGVVPNF